MTNYEDEDKVKIETKPNDTDFAEEYGESATYMDSDCNATKRP